MKFSIRFLLLETFLIAVFLGCCCWKPRWILGEFFYLHAIELIVLTTLLLISLSAAIGGLFLRPGRGAIVGLILSLILVPIALLGSMF